MHRAQDSAGLGFERIDATPYDTQIARVEQFILRNAGQGGDDAPSIEQVNQWMRRLHAIRYEYTPAWKTPDEVQRTGSGDCKAKAVCLYYLMRAYGARNVLIVVGRKTSSSPGTHVWLLWKARGRLFILDPTDASKALEIHGFDGKRYLPHFAYSGGRKYRPT